MLNKFIDQTNLRPNTTKQDIDKLIIETWTNEFYGICVSSCWTKYVSEQLKWINQNGIDKFERRPEWDFLNNNWKERQTLSCQHKVKVITVVGFPLGNDSINSKVSTAHEALKDGAHEIDMVINIGMFLSGEYDYVKKEINSIKVGCNNCVLKVIVETGYLNEKQLIDVVKIVNETNADFIKTSTGFGPRGASFDDVKIIKQYIKETKQIKAAGGIGTYEAASEFIKLGATRIGTSNGAKIIKKE